MQLALADHVEVGHRRGRREEERHVDEQHLVPAHVVADDHRRRHQHRQDAHQRVVEVRRQVEERLRLDAERQVRPEDVRQQLAARLDGALRPPVLLRLEGVHLHRHFGRRNQAGHEDEPPAAQLRAVAEVEVLGQRVVLPAARIGDRLAPPDARRAVEVEEESRAVPAAVLEHEVRVEQDRLHLRQQRVVLVDVPPARLHHGDLRIAEEIDRALQEVGGRHEVGVEDGDEPSLRHPEPRVERARLVAGAIGAMHVRDVDPLRRVAAHRALRDARRLVGGVVQHLDLEQLARIIDLADRVDQPVRDVHLVVDRQLDGDRRQLRERRARHRHLVLVLHVQIDQVVPVPPVHGENDENEEICAQDQGFAGGHRAGADAIRTISNYTDTVVQQEATKTSL